MYFSETFKETERIALSVLNSPSLYETAQDIETGYQP